MLLAVKTLNVTSAFRSVTISRYFNGLFFYLVKLPDVQYRGHKCEAFFFATLLQNDMKSYVACFTTHIQTCLATHQVVGSCVNTVF